MVLTMSKNIRVLVCDEETKFRASLASLLTQKGFETFQAKSGFQVLSMMEEREFHAVLLCGEMLDMGALEIIGIAKDKIDTDGKIRFLIITDEKEAELKEFDYFDRKEGPSELVLKIQSLLAPPKKKESAASNSLSKFFGSKKS